MLRHTPVVCSLVWEDGMELRGSAYRMMVSMTGDTWGTIRLFEPTLEHMLHISRERMAYTRVDVHDLLDRRNSLHIQVLLLLLLLLESLPFV